MPGSNFFRWLKIKFKNYSYLNAIQEEKELEIEESINQAKDAMLLLRESLIKIYGYSTTNTDNN